MRSYGAQVESFNEVFCLREFFGFCKNIQAQSSKNRCVRREQLRWHMFVNPFLPVQMGSRSDLLSKKNGYKSHDTVPLTVRAGYKKNFKYVGQWKKSNQN